MMVASSETFIKDAPGLAYLAKNLERCEDCQSVVSSVSIAGGPPGSQYCVTGSGFMFSPVEGNGGGTACMTI
jgi:hypothetical protein